MQYEIKKVDSHISGHLDWVCDILFFELVKCDKCLHEHKEYYTFEDTTEIVGYVNAQNKAIEIIEVYEDENFGYDTINERQLEDLETTFCDNVDKVIALGKELQLSYSELVDIVVTGSNAFVVGNKEYLVLTDEEANEAVTDDILDSICAFNNDFLFFHTGLSKKSIKHLQELFEDANEILKKCIVDLDDFVKDAVRSDGKGHFLAKYDSEELESRYNDTTYYIYRTN